ncbi:MAG: CBS domain-containing protein [Halothece sp.]
MTKTVADAMTTDVAVVKPETPLKEAIQLLVEKKISGLPVVNEAGKLVGILSESDLMWQETGVDTPPYIMFLDSVIYLQNPAQYEKELHKALGQTVGEVMSNRPISITRDRALKEAAQIMHKREVRRLPVVDEQGAVVGIITRGDIVKTMADQ